MFRHSLHKTSLIKDNLKWKKTALEIGPNYLLAIIHIHVVYIFIQTQRIHLVQNGVKSILENVEQF